MSGEEIVNVIQQLEAKGMETEAIIESLKHVEMTECNIEAK